MNFLTGYNNIVLNSIWKNHTKANNTQDTLSPVVHVVQIDKSITQFEQ